jgi:hypothetical protein
LQQRKPRFSLELKRPKSNDVTLYPPPNYDLLQIGDPANWIANNAQKAAGRRIGPARIHKVSLS